MINYWNLYYWFCQNISMVGKPALSKKPIWFKITFLELKNDMKLTLLWYYALKKPAISCIYWTIVFVCWKLTAFKGTEYHTHNFYIRISRNMELNCGLDRCCWLCNHISQMLRGLKNWYERVRGEKGNLRPVKIAIVIFRHATDLFLSNYIRTTSPRSKFPTDKYE